jgi:hypothetical protein
MENTEDNDINDLDFDYVPEGLEGLAEEIRSEGNIAAGEEGGGMEDGLVGMTALGKDDDLDVRKECISLA